MQHLLSTRGNTICAHVIGNGNNIADLPSSGTTRVARCTSGCQHTSKKLSNVSNIPHPELNRTNPTSTSRRNTVQKNNVQNHLTTPPFGQGREEVHSRRYRSFLFLARAIDGTMLTPLSALASEQATPTEPQWKNASNSSTTWHPKRM